MQSCCFQHSLNDVLVMRFPAALNGMALPIKRHLSKLKFMVLIVQNSINILWEKKIAPYFFCWFSKDSNKIIIFGGPLIQFHSEKIKCLLSYIDNTSFTLI